MSIDYKSEPLDILALVASLCGKHLFSDQMEYMKQHALLDHQHLAVRVSLAHDLETILGRRGIHGTCSLFGSSANTLGFKDSDVDIYFHLPNYSTEPDKAHSRRDLYRKMESIQCILSRELRLDIEPPIKARVPIIQLDFSPKYANGLKCDISLLSPHGIVHAKLVEHLCKIEPLFRDLCLAIKFWMRATNFTGRESLNSISAVILVMFYMQQKGLLPAVRTLQSSPSTSFIASNEFNSGCHSFVSLRSKPNIAQLFVGFFTFYRKFDFNNNIVSPNHGIELSKSSHGIFITKNPKSTSQIVIQDVFDLKRNQAFSMSGSFERRLTSLFLEIHEMVTSLNGEYGSGNDDFVAAMVFAFLLRKRFN